MNMQQITTRQLQRYIRLNLAARWLVRPIHWIKTLWDKCFSPLPYGSWCGPEKPFGEVYYVAHPDDDSFDVMQQAWKRYGFKPILIEQVSPNLWRVKVGDEVTP